MTNRLLILSFLFLVNVSYWACLRNSLSFRQKNINHHHSMIMNITSSIFVLLSLLSIIVFVLLPYKLTWLIAIVIIDSVGLIGIETVKIFITKYVNVGDLEDTIIVSELVGFFLYYFLIFINPIYSLHTIINSEEINVVWLIVFFISFLITAFLFCKFTF